MASAGNVRKLKKKNEKKIPLPNERKILLVQQTLGTPETQQTTKEPKKRNVRCFAR